MPADLLRSVSVWVSLGGERIPYRLSSCSYCCLYFVFVVSAALLPFSSLTNLNLFLSLSGYRIFHHLNQFAFLYCFFFVVVLYVVIFIISFFPLAFGLGLFIFSFCKLQASLLICFLM